MLTYLLSNEDNVYKPVSWNRKMLTLRYSINLIVLRNHDEEGLLS